MDERMRDIPSPERCETMEQLLKADWGGKWGEPFSAEEVLEIGRRVFDPLFLEPPLGPIPDYVKPHSSLYGCVAEYEEKIEELGRWKARRLSLWLQDKVGKSYRAGAKAYAFHMVEGKDPEPARYRFKLIED